MHFEFSLLLQRNKLVKDTLDVSLLVIHVVIGHNRGNHFPKLALDSFVPLSDVEGDFNDLSNFLLDLLNQPVDFVIINDDLLATCALFLGVDEDLAEASLHVLVV